VAESVLRFRVETADANAKIAHLTKKVQGLEVAVLKAGGTTQTAATGMRAMGKGAQAAAVGARGLGTAVNAALGPIGLLLSAAGALTQAFGVLAKQDFAEAKVRTLGVNSEELTKRLKGVSRELNGQASVTELTAAAYDVASAGFANAADNARILQAASQGATGGFSDINTVADAATSVLNAYGKTADEVSAVVDGFIQTQNDGKIIIGQYAANIAKVSPVAAALGVELAEVNAAVAQITAAGTNAEVTFTGLKTALAQVAAGKVGQEFKKFGIEINASTIRSEGLAGTLEKIKKSGADAGTVIKAFGTEAGPAILALLEDTEKFNKLLENQRQAQGAAAKAAFEASDTINGSLNRLRVAFENLFADGSELGDLLKLIFKAAAVTVEVFGVTINNLLAPFRAIGAAVNQVGEAIGEALGMKGVNIAFEMQEAYKGVLDVFTQVSDFIVGLGVRFGDFLGGIVTGTNETANKIKDNLIGGFKDAFDGIKTAMQNFYNGLPGWAKFLIEGAAKAAGIVGGLVQTAMGGVQQVAQNVIGAAAPLVTGAGGAIQQFAQTTIAAGQGFKAEERLRTANAQQQQAANGIVPTGGGLGGQFQMPGFSGSGMDPTVSADEAFAKQVEKLAEGNMLLEARLEGNEREEQQRQAIANIIERSGFIDKERIDDAKRTLQAIFDQTNALEEQGKAQDELDKKQKKAGERMQALYADIGTTIKDSVVDGITGAIQGTKKLKDVAMDLMNKLLSKLIDFAVNAALFGLGGMGSGGGLLGGLFKFPAKAMGGPVSGGSTYMVGERGPELFTPNRSGTIIPNHALTGNSNITVNVDATGSSVEGNAEDSKRLGEAIGIAIRTELIKQKRPGGLLS